jgi:type I restriction enzyme S subunit
MPADRPEGGAIMSLAVAEETYYRTRCVVFSKTREPFGGLSNMAAGFPLVVNGQPIERVESLYQACRYPHLPEVQCAILAEPNPMKAKMISRKYYPQSRPDWDAVCTPVMRWCLHVKLAQNWETFGALLAATGDRPVVEKAPRNTARDRLWGAWPVDDERLVGHNLLGRLLVELRREYLQPDNTRLRIVAPLPIGDFLLLGEPIRTITAADAGRVD